VYPGAASDKIRVSTGDTGDAWLPEERIGTLPDGFHPATWHAADLTDFLGISAPFVSWRVLVTGILLLIGLAVFLAVRLISLVLPNREKPGAAVWLLLAVFCVAAAEAEGAYWLLADCPWIRFAWKAVAGAAVLAVFFLQRRKDEKLLYSVFPGLAAIIAADLVMTFAFLPGLVLFLLGHVPLIAGFLRKKTMTRPQWIQWAVLSLIAAGLVVLFFVSRAGWKAWAAAAYLPVLLLMVYSANGQAPRIRYAAGFFLVSDLLLGAFGTVWREPPAHILCMTLFSASLMLLALRKKGKAENNR